jgi:hypothetical protein
MLQVFYLDIAKVDLDVAYTCMLQAYVSSVFRCFVRMFASVSSDFIRMLHMFAMVFKCILGVFVSVSDACFKCFICLFLMLQLLHLNISKVDQVLHMGYMQKAAGGAHNIWGGVDPLLVHSLAHPTG